MTSVHALAFLFWADFNDGIYDNVLSHSIMHIGARTKPWILTTPLFPNLP